MMNYLLLVAVIIASGCTSTGPGHRWEVQGYGKVICYGQPSVSSCGLSISKCTESKSVEFSCLNDAKYVGAGDHFEPDMYEENK